MGSRRFFVVLTRGKKAFKKSRLRVI